MRPAILFVVTMLITISTFAQLPQNRINSYKGHAITTTYAYDTVAVEDPVSGEISYVITRGEKVDLLDGEPIYYLNEATEPVGAAAQKNIRSFLNDLAAGHLEQIKEEKMQLLIVINKNGKLAYFVPRYASGQDIENDNIPTEYEIIEEKIENVKFVPAMKDGKAVPYCIYMSFFY